MNKRWLNWDGSDVPEHTQESIENYIIHGYSPGGFVTAVMQNNLVMAVAKADHINREHLPQIARWLMTADLPPCWGTEFAVHDWICDKGGLRTEYAGHMEKKRMWAVLKETL